MVQAKTTKNDEMLPKNKISDFFSVNRWRITNSDKQNKCEMSKVNKKDILPPLGNKMIPRISAFYVDDGIFQGNVLQKGLKYNPDKDKWKCLLLKLKMTVTNQVIRE